MTGWGPPETECSRATASGCFLHVCVGVKRGEKRHTERLLMDSWWSLACAEWRQEMDLFCWLASSCTCTAQHLFHLRRAGSWDRISTGSFSSRNTCLQGEDEQEIKLQDASYGRNWSFLTKVKDSLDRLINQGVLLKEPDLGNYLFYANNDQQPVTSSMTTTGNIHILRWSFQLR